MGRLFKPHVEATNVYIPPNCSNPGQKRLFMNENLFGCAPSCLEVLQRVTPEKLLKYAIGDSGLLKEAISERYGVDAGKILVHAGEAELLKQIFQAFLEQGDKVLTSRHSWSYYRVLSGLQGAEVINYDLREEDEEFSFNPQEIIRTTEAVKPKIIVLISPNMPTGNSLKREDLEAILNTAKDSIVILDEAYLGFEETDKEEDNYSDLDSFLEQHPNLIIARTFSKLYALASLRVGYALCDDKVHDYLQKSSPLFGVNYLSQLVAMEALKSREYYEGIRRQMVETRHGFKRTVGEETDFKVYRSDANFMLMRVDEKNAAPIQTFLGDNGFLVRDCSKYHLPDFVRITMGTSDDMRQVASLINQYHSRIIEQD